MSATGHLTNTKRKSLYTTPHPFEQRFGYYRAVRRGPFIAVSGTTALKFLAVGSDASVNPSASQGNVNSSKVHYPGDVRAQSIHVLHTCLTAVTEMGGSKEDVIRVRMFVANGDDCESVGAAFREIFGTVNQTSDGADGGQDVVGAAATMIVVPGGFVDGEILVEIEVDAFVVA